MTMMVMFKSKSPVAPAKQQVSVRERRQVLQRRAIMMILAIIMTTMMMMMVFNSRSPVAPAKQQVSRKTTSKAEEGDDGRRDAAVVRRDGTFEISLIILIIITVYCHRY